MRTYTLSRLSSLQEHLAWAFWKGLYQSSEQGVFSEPHVFPGIDQEVGNLEKVAKLGFEPRPHSKTLSLASEPSCSMVRNCKSDLYLHGFQYFLLLSVEKMINF